MTTDTTILNMLRQLADADKLHLADPERWAKNFDVSEEEMKGFIEDVRKGR